VAKFRLLGDDSSILLTEEENSCRITFQRLLDKHWNETKTYDKLLKLALEYHRLSFTLERADHAFLILMVVFEALFKKENDKSINNAADRIAKLLATVQTELKPIRKAFLNRPSTAFLLIRNGIAHGDPTLDRAIVRNHYIELYGYITKAIIKLINIPDSTIGANYYDDLEQYISTEFFKLNRS
jgi:streptomycin 6-kinase